MFKVAKIMVSTRAFSRLLVNIRQIQSHQQQIENIDKKKRYTEPAIEFKEENSNKLVFLSIMGRRLKTKIVTAAMNDGQHHYSEQTIE